MNMVPLSDGQQRLLGSTVVPNRHSDQQASWHKRGQKISDQASEHGSDAIALAI
jgi:hypothetical protein